jgi:hypothetical protein
MSKQFNITAADNVFIGMAKAVKVKCVDRAGAPLDLTGKDLTWTMRAGSAGRVLLTKASADAEITLEDGDGNNDVAVVALLPGDTFDDVLGTILIEPGRYAHALKSESDDDVLSYGDFTLRLSAAR